MTARRYFAPTSVEEALAVVAEHGRVGVVAGGTDVVVNHRSEKRPLADVVIGIHRLSELSGIREANDGSMCLGALTTYASLLSSTAIATRLTALADACEIVGGPSTRHVGTLGGNIVNASPAMDAGAPLLVFDATTDLRSRSKTRQVPITELWTGPGESVIGDDELLTSVTVPSLPARSGSAYLRLEYRRAMEIAVVGAAAAVSFAEDGTVASASIALAAVGPTCFVADAAEQALVGRRLDAAVLGEAAEAAADTARPITDIRAGSNYRRRMVSVLTKRAVSVAAARAAGEHVAVPASQHWRDAVTNEDMTA